MKAENKKKYGSQGKMTGKDSAGSGSRKSRDSKSSGVIQANPKTESAATEKRTHDNTPPISFEEYKKRRLAGESHEDIENSIYPNRNRPSGGKLKGQGPNDEDMMRIALAAETGNISFSPYLRNAVSNYEKADNRARQELRGAGLMPDDPRYEEWKDTLIQQYYGDKYIPYDMAAKALGYSNELNNAAYMADQTRDENFQVKQFQAAMDKIDPVTGMSYEELNAQKPSFVQKPNLSQGIGAGLSAIPGASPPNQDTGVSPDPDYDAFMRAAGGYGKF